MPNFLNTRFFSFFKKKSPQVVPKTPVERFIQIITEEYKSVKSVFPEDYQPLLTRVSPDDLRGILKWIIRHPDRLTSLSPDHPIRIEGAKSGQTASYPFPITLHFTMDTTGNMQLVYDPNSKLARRKKSAKILKDPETKSDEKPLKIRGQGAQKKVRDTWTFHAATRKLEPTVANVVTGRQALKDFYCGKALYQADNPFILPISYGTEYKGHGQRDKNQPKAISFAPRAEGGLIDIINDMDTIKPDLADILWICYAATRSLTLFHVAGRLHRDVKPENFLFLRHPHGLSVYLNDWDYGLKKGDAHTQQSEVGSPSYIAFDRPYFNSLLKAHNQVIREIAWFKTKEAAHCYRNGQMDSTAQNMYRYYHSRRFTPTGKLQDPFQTYMEWRTRTVVQEIKKRHSAYPYAIQIILNKRESIALNTPSHAKDDVWALCLSLWHLCDSFVVYQGYNESKPIPGILKKINQLLMENLQAPRAKRLSMQALCVKLEQLFKQMMNGPIAGLSEAARSACGKKIADQFNYFKVKMSELPISVPPSPTASLPPAAFSFSPPDSKGSASVSEGPPSLEASSDTESWSLLLENSTPPKQLSKTEKLKISVAAASQRSGSSFFASRSSLVKSVSDTALPRDKCYETFMVNL